MDTQSMSITLASLLGAAEDIARHLSRYPKTVEGIEKQINGLSTKIISLHGLLSSLHLKALCLDCDIPKQESMRSDHIQTCHSDLDSIRSLLHIDDYSLESFDIGSTPQRSHWPFSVSKTEELVAAIGRHRQILAFALNANTSATFLDALLPCKDTPIKDVPEDPDLPEVGSQAGQDARSFRTSKEEIADPSVLSYSQKSSIEVNLGWDSAMKRFEKGKADSSASKAEFEPLWYNAARFGKKHVVERLMENIEESDSGLDINMHCGPIGDNTTALHVACFFGHPEIVELLLNGGIAIDQVDCFGRTALWAAVSQDHHDCVRILVRRNCALDLVDNHTITAMHFAALCQDTRMMEILMSSPVSKRTISYPRVDTGQTILHCAAKMGRLVNVEFIMEHFPQASLDECMNDGRNGLYSACASGSLETIDFFLDHGLSINHRTHETLPPVFDAINGAENPAQVINHLHSRGLDLNMPSGKDALPLFHAIGQACKRNDQITFDSFSYIADHTKNINHCDDRGYNALHWLASLQPEIYPSVYYQNMCLDLLRRGCSMTKKNILGNSPFQLFVDAWSELPIYDDGFIDFQYEPGAVERGESERLAQYKAYRSQVGMTMLIIEQAKADPNILGPPDEVNCKGSSLLSLAVRTASIEIVERVMRYDCDVDWRDTAPGLGSFTLRSPLEWMCTGFSPPDPQFIRKILKSSKSVEQQGADGLAAVHIAASNGNVEVLAEILNMGIDADSLSADGKTPMMYACDHRRKNAMRFLYDHGARAVVSDQWDSVREACLKGDLSVLADLFDMPKLQFDWARTFRYGLDDGPQSDRNVPVLHTMSYYHLAAYKGHRQILDWLMACGIVQDVNATICRDNLTALYLAAHDEDSHKNTLPFLFSKGADMTLKSGDFDWTALHAAAKANNIEGIKFLIARGADTSIEDRRDFTPRLVALDNNSVEAAELLSDNEVLRKRTGELSAGQRANNDSITTEGILTSEKHIDSLVRPLHYCLESGNVSMVRRLLDDGADVNSRGQRCITPAMRAAEKGHLEMLDLLRERGADFHAVDLFGQKALHYACHGQQAAVIPCLLACGLNLTDVDFVHKTPLHCAVGGYSKTFHDLIMNQASVASLTPLQLSSLADRSISQGSTEMLRWILGQVDIAQKQYLLEVETDGANLLQTATAINCFEALNTLLAEGADINRASEKRDAPLGLAASMGKLRTVRYLVEKRALLDWEMKGGGQRSALDAASKYPHIQQWLREYFNI